MSPTSTEPNLSLRMPDRAVAVARGGVKVAVPVEEDAAIIAAAAATVVAEAGTRSQ